MLLKNRYKFSLSKLLVYIEFFLIIYQSGTVQAAINSEDILFIALRIVQLTIALILAIKGFTRKNVFFNAVKLLIILEAFALINFFNFSQSAAALQYRIFLFLIFFGMIGYCKKRIDILEVFYNILVFIAAITMIMYVIVGLMNVPLDYSIMHIPGGVYYKNYYNIFYSYSEKTIPRICGLFWEPGVYQIYLNLGLFIYVVKNKKQILEFLLLIMSVLFTQSTTGYMIAAIICGVHFTRSKWFAKKSKIVINFIMSVAVLTIIALSYIQKKLETNFIGDSYSLRIGDIFLSLSLFAQQPFFGTGFYNTAAFTMLDQFGRGNSNGLLTWLYTTGIVGMFLAAFPYFYNIMHTNDKVIKTNRILLLIVVAMINLTEPIYNLALMIFIEAYVYYLALNKGRPF